MLRIPGYILKREIGVGGMASVYLAVQTSLERQVALKVMAPALAADQSFSKRFLREARTVAGLSHPNIVSIYDVGITKDQVHYFSMQHMTGGDFADRIKKGLHEREIIRVLMGIAEALGYAHKRGFVHRDVTPGNILFDGSETPVLTDFGIVKAVSDSTRITGTGLSIGTSAYMSPEQARGRSVDPRSDLYSLGAVTYESLAGRPPFEGEDGFAIAYSHVFDPVPKLPQRLERWNPFIQRAMAKDPNERYQTAGEMIEDMSEFLEKTTGAGRIRSKPKLLSKEGIEAAAESAAAGALVRHLKTFGSVLKGAPGSVRFAVWDTLARVGNGLLGSWELMCQRLFFFLPRERQSLSGLVIAFVVLSLTGMSIDWSGGDLPVTTRVSIAATTDKLSEMTPAVMSTENLPEPRSLSGSSPPPLTGEAAARELRLAAERAALEGRNLDSTPVDDESVDAEAADGEDTTVAMVTDEQRIESLLAEAGADLLANRLSTPADGNARQRFRTVLEMDPGNAAAQSGMVSIVERYLDLAEAEIRRSDYPRVAQYIERGEETGEGLELPGALRARFEATRRLAYDGAKEAAQEAHVARRVQEAVALYQASLIFVPDDDEAIEAIAMLRSGQAANQSFSDLLSDGSPGPELVVVDLTPFDLETAAGPIQVNDRRKLAVTVGEVTVSQFRQFVEATDYFEPRKNRRACRDQESIWRSSRRRTWDDPGFPQGDDHPVTCITWDAAQAYAAWLSSETGLSYRLPGEAEWEFLVSRGPDRRHADAAICEKANVGDLWLKSQFPDMAIQDCEDGWAFTAPAASFIGTESGVHDLQGNVREWVADCWEEVRNTEVDSFSPQLGGECRKRVVKGTSWLHDAEWDQYDMRLGFDPKSAFNTVGFRLVRTLD